MGTSYLSDDASVWYRKAPRIGGFVTCRFCVGGSVLGAAMQADQWPVDNLSGGMWRVQQRVTHAW